jgi:hypothetical protein
MNTPPDDPAGREKLLTVMGQIDELLKANDMCASVVLALPEQSETRVHLAASWSVAHFDSSSDGMQGIRVRSKKADYEDQAVRTRHLEATLGMLESIGQLAAMHGILMIEAGRAAGTHVDVVHSPLTKVHKQ